MYCIIDIETNGGNKRKGKITEIAIYVHDGNKIIRSFSTLINPECSIPLHITELTGIDNNMVINAPKFHEVAKTIVELTAGNIFIAHNVTFDYHFLQEEFKQLGYEYTRKTLCTIKLSRKYLPGHPSYSLGNICRDLNIIIEGRHRAEGDALATVKLFEYILKKQNESGLFSTANNHL